MIALISYYHRFSQTEPFGFIFFTIVNKTIDQTIVVQEFYYNAIPKAPPKREYGESTVPKLPAPPITPLSPRT